MKSCSIKKILHFKFLVPISIFVLGIIFTAFFINCSINLQDEEFSSSSYDQSSEIKDFIGDSTQTQEQINKNCDYESNDCHNGTKVDVPDINRTSKWQCQGSFGTAHCAKPSKAAACSGEWYCLDGEQESLSATDTHEWIKCNEDGLITHCSKPKEGVVDGYCNNAENNGCLSGILNDTPDINRTFKWECVGENGGVTAYCEKANTVAFACSLEGYCLDGEFLDLQNTATHNWFQCTESDGTVTHCSTLLDTTTTTVNNNINGACGGDDQGPYCLDGTYTLIEETSSYWKYNCVGSGTGATEECFQCKNTPHFGANKNQTACLPSCGHAKSIYCKTNDCNGFNIARGSQCAANANYIIHQLETYETNSCCLKKQGQTPPTTQLPAGGGTVTTTTTQIPVGGVTTTTSKNPAVVNGACGGDGQGPYCLDGIYKLIEETGAHWKYQCAGTGGGSTANCLQCKNHYKSVNSVCTPSCGHAFSIYCKSNNCTGLDHKNGQANCSNPSGWQIIKNLTAYDGPCCVRRRQ